TLRVTCEGYTFNTVKGIKVVQGEVNGDVEIVLSKGGTVEGYVYDYEGKAQANVTLFFQDDTGYGGGGDEEAGRFATAITDANGFYHVDSLPEQMCHVRRSDSGRSLGVVCRSILPQNGVTARLDFGGEPVLFGRMVVDSAPLANARVALGDKDLPYWGIHKCYARTDSEGRFGFPGTPVGRYGIYYEQPDKRGEWVKVAVVETGTGDTDLGTVPGQMGTVRISVAADANGPLPEELGVYLESGRRYYGPQAGTITEPTAEGQPYIATNLLPGVYTVTARRSDRVRFRKVLELKEGQSPLDVTLTIPKCSASISGAFRSETDQSLVMWSGQEAVVASIVPKDGRYTVENLPAGDYAVGRRVPPRGRALLEFSLAEGESKALDLDTSDWLAPDGVSRLLVQAVDRVSGIPLTAARIWLSRSDRIFEVDANWNKGSMFDVPPGDYVLHAECIGYQQAEKAIEIGHVPSTFIRLTPQQ
ncbi:MAG: MSCRAMM family protein, partial [Planctomycetota bacterium]